MTSDPLVALVPFHPSLAEQLVALLETHVSVDDPPLAVLVGDALSVSVGRGTTVTFADWLTEPPGPVQVRV